VPPASASSRPEALKTAWSLRGHRIDGARVSILITNHKPVHWYSGPPENESSHFIVCSFFRGKYSFVFVLLLTAHGPRATSPRLILQPT
jgi:hypothetical protein